MTHADRIYEFLSDGNSINSEIAQREFGITPKYFYKVIAELGTEIDLVISVENRLKTYTIADEVDDTFVEPVVEIVVQKADQKDTAPLIQAFLEIVNSGGVVCPAEFAKKYHTTQKYVFGIATRLRKQGHKIVSVARQDHNFQVGPSPVNYILSSTDPGSVGMKYKLMDQMYVDLKMNSLVNMKKYSAYPTQAAILVRQLRKEGHNIHTIRTPTETFYQLIED